MLTAGLLLAGCGGVALVEDSQGAAGVGASNDASGGAGSGVVLVEDSQGAAGVGASNDASGGSWAGATSTGGMRDCDARLAAETAAEACSYSFVEPEDPERYEPTNWGVRLTIGGEVREMSRATSASCVDGQWYTSMASNDVFPGEIALCTSTCARVQNDPEAIVELEYHCFQP